MTKKICLTTVLSLFVIALSFGQGRVDYSSSSNQSLYFSTSKNVKNWFSMAVNSSPTGGYYTLNGSQMQKPVFLPIKEAYQLDNGYYAIKLAIDGSPFFFLFSQTLARALLVSYSADSIPMKIELRNAVGADPKDTPVKIEDMLSLLNLLL